MWLRCRRLTLKREVAAGEDVAEAERRFRVGVTPLQVINMGMGRARLRVTAHAARADLEDIVKGHHLLQKC